MITLSKFRLLLTLISALCIQQVDAVSQKIAKEGKPNILLIVVDDLGWSDLGVYGSKFYESPNIDKLAASSDLYRSAYAASPVCSPTRAALMTGKHPTSLKITTHFPGFKAKNPLLQEPKRVTHLSLDEYTIAEALKKINYSTFFAGKWHLGNEGEWPEDQGFDINKGGMNRGSPPGGYYSPYKNPRLENGPDGEHLTARLTDETISFLSKDHNKPFFAMLSYYSVHTPLDSGPEKEAYFEGKAKTMGLKPLNIIPGAHKGKGTGKEYLLDKQHNSRTQKTQNDPRYASMIWAVDKSIGRIMSVLEKQKLDKNTVVILTSDNGGFSTRLQGDTRVTATNNNPLRSGKGWVYEGGIRIPLLIKTPQNHQTKNIDTLTTTSDLYPTILTFAQASIPENIDGIALQKLNQNSQMNQARPIVWHHPHYHGSGNTPSVAIRQGDWKLLHFYQSDQYELYNISDDIGEQNNQVTNQVQIKQKLQTLLANWYQEKSVKPLKRIKY